MTVRVSLARYRRPVEVALLGVVPIPVLAVLVGISIHDGNLGFDARVLLEAAGRIAGGVAPGTTYPPLVPTLLVPLTFVPHAAELLAFAALATVPVSLALLGVRDWRVFGAVLLWAPVFSGVQTANATLFLVLGAAVAWQLRGRAASAAGLVAGVAIAAKLISVLLVVWLVGTRRWRAATVAVVVAVSTTGILLAMVSALDGPGAGGVTSSIRGVPGSSLTPSYSIVDMTRAAGAPTIAGYAIQGAVGLTLCVLSVVVGLRRDDRSSFALSALATLVLAPNVWLHSFSFLLLLLAVMCPVFSPVWLLPVVMVALPVRDPGAVEMAVAWAVAAAVVAVALLRPAPCVRDRRVQGTNARHG